MTILNGNNSLPHIKDAAWLAERQKRLAAFKPDCRHGNDPEQCATCLKERGVKPVEPDRAAVTAPRVMPPRRPCQHIYKCVICTEPAKPTGVSLAWLRDRLAAGRDAFVARATQPELVMVALVESGQKTFTREDVAVLAFRAFPTKFSLREYKQYPNASKVFAIIDGERGLVKAGWLVKTDSGYELPRE